MIKNNNRKITRKLALQSIYSGKMRNAFIILTVILSSALLSGMLLSYKNKVKIDEIELDGMQHVIYHNVTEEQIESLNQEERVESMLLYKQGKNMEVENYIIVPCYYERKDSPIQNIKIVKGAYPMKLNEIAVDESYMKQIGCPVTLGEVLTFTFLDGTKEEFTVSGFTNSGAKSKVYALYLSEEYAREGSQLKEVVYNAAVRIKGAKSMGESEFLESIRQLASDCNILRQNINENNHFVLSLTMTSSEYLFLGIIGITILFVSVLVIRSIFYISVVGRIREFGQLRTLGTTQKQIRHMIRLEGLILCLAGVPFGLIIGDSFSYLLLPKGFDIKNTVMVDLTVLLINLITVLWSIRKPAKIAARISPIEASKVSSTMNLRKEWLNNKVRHKQLTPFHLARLSTRSNRKKNFLTMISLGIAGVLYFSGATFITSMNREEYSKQGWFQYGEFVIYLSSNAAEMNPIGYTGIQLDNPLNQEFIQNVLNIQGVKAIEPLQSLNVKYSYHNITDEDSFASFSREEEEWLKEGLVEGDINYDKMVKNNEVIVCLNDVAKEIFGWKFKVGDRISIRWFNGKEEKERTFTISGSVNYTESNFKIVYNAGWFLVPEDTMKGMMAEGFHFNQRIIVKTEDYKKYGESVESRLEELIDNNPFLTMDTFRERLIEDASTFQTLQGMVMGMAAFVIGFALINLVNTLTTNVLMRKQEFAVLESIGMEKQQLSAMIQLEGLLLALGNLLITVCLGTVGGYGIIALLRDIGATYMHFRFPFWYMIGYTILIVVAPLIISRISFHIFQKKSLVERIREIAG